MVSKELLLCGSGVLAFAHIGVLKALKERGVTLDSIAGTSTGALVAALHANGVTPSVIHELFLNKHPKRLNTADWLGEGNGCSLNPRMYCSVTDLVPAARTFVRENELKPRDGLSIMSYDLLGRKPVVFHGRHYDLALALAAACAVPGINRPVRTGERLLVDIATQAWQPVSHCGTSGMISRAAYDGDEVSLLTKLDKWLRKRRLLLHVSECPTDKCTGEHIVIETKLKAESCACEPGDKAREAIIAAGYAAAQSALR